MTVHHLSRDLETEEPPLADGRAHVWVGALIAVLLLGGAAVSIVAVGDADSIANHQIATAHSLTAAAAP